MRILASRAEAMQSVRQAAEKAGGLVTAILALAATALVTALVALVVAVKGRHCARA